METTKQWNAVTDILCKRMKFLVVFVIACSSLTHGQTGQLDECSEEENCSAEISNTSTLHCRVGKLRACNNVKLSNSIGDLQREELYPYLSAISIYQRLYPGHLEVDSFKFAFIIPSSDVGDVGISGVKAEFMDAIGHPDNDHYKDPVCRFFNFSGSYIVKSVIAEIQPKISYSCIGIGINPGVFNLHLTSVPTAHQLNYVIKWQRQFYQDYDSTWYAWPQRNQLVAITAVDEAELRLVHVVFQSPTTEIGITFLHVALVTTLKAEVKDFKQVEPDETSVTFKNVEPGHYKVVVRPHGGVCDLEPDYCDELTSADVWIHGQAEDSVITTTGESSRFLVIVGTVLGIVGLFLGVSFAFVMVACARRRQNRGPKGPKVIIVSSFATRDLEKQVTSYFCTFLSTALDTEVAFTLPAMKPNGSREFTLVTVRRDNEADISSSLLLPEAEAERTRLMRDCVAHVILQFSYQLYSTSSDSGALECLQLDKLLYSSQRPDGKRWSTLKYLPFKKRSQVLTPFIVTFVHGASHEDKGDSCFEGIPGASSSNQFPGDVEDGGSVVTDDHITVMLNPHPRHVPPKDNISLYNKLSNNKSRGICNTGKEYLLPHDLCMLHRDLKSRVLVKKAQQTLEDDSDVSASRYWKVALHVFHKAAENRHLLKDVHEDCRDGLVSEAVTIWEQTSDKYVHEHFDRNFQTSVKHHLPFSPYPPQNQEIQMAIEKCHPFVNGASNNPDYFPKLDQCQDHSHQASSHRYLSRASDIDSYSNMTEAERYLLGRSVCRSSTLSLVLPENADTDRILSSEASKLNHSGLSHDSSSIHIMTGGDDKDGYAMHHEDCPSMAVAAPGSENCNRTDMGDKVLRCSALQREISLKSECTSGYESNDTPQSDIAQFSWSTGERGTRESEGLYHEGLADSYKEDSKFRPDVPAEDSAKISHDCKEVARCVSNYSDVTPKGQREYIIYPESFMKSIKPPEFF